MLINERSFSSAAYKYGFNGKEKDNEINVDGGDYDFGARIYDSRLGRWLALDPQQNKYPNLSPFIYCANVPILFIDPDGKKIIKPTGEYGEVFQKLANSNIPVFDEMCNLFAPNENPSIEKNIEFVLITMFQYTQRGNYNDEMPFAFAVKSNNNTSQIFCISNFATDFNQRTATEGAIKIDILMVQQIIRGKNAANEPYTAAEEAQWRIDAAFKEVPSELSMVITMYHEMIHAKHFLIDNLPPENAKLTHERMATVEISKIRELITAYGLKNNLDLKDNEIEALSFAGLEKTEAFNTYLNSKAGIPNDWDSDENVRVHPEYGDKRKEAWKNYKEIRDNRLLKRDYINKHK